MNLADEPLPKHSFDTQLVKSLAKFKEDGKRGIWLKIPLARADAVPVAAKHSFTFHHAEPVGSLNIKDLFIILTQC